MSNLNFNYTHHDWETGEVITEAKMDNIENGILDLCNEIDIACSALADGNGNSLGNKASLLSQLSMINTRINETVTQLSNVMVEIANARTGYDDGHGNIMPTSESLAGQLRLIHTRINTVVDILSAAQESLTTENGDVMTFSSLANKLSQLNTRINTISSTVTPYLREKHIEIPVSTVAQLIAALEQARVGETPTVYYDIKLAEGTYNLWNALDKSQITGSGDQLYHRGLELPDRCNLYGIGNVTIKCVIPESDNAYSRIVSTLNMHNTENILENIHFIGDNTRYCIHDDSGFDESFKTLIVNNCTFTHKGTNQTLENNPNTYPPCFCYGAGYTTGRKAYFNNCIFESQNNSEIQLYVHTHTNTADYTYNLSDIEVHVNDCAFITPNTIPIHYQIPWNTKYGGKLIINNNYFASGCKILLDGTEDANDPGIVFGSGNSTIEFDNQNNSQIYVVDEITSLQQANSSEINFLRTNNRIHNGITYNWLDEYTCHLTGTASEVSFSNLILNSQGLPKPIKPGDKLYVYFNRNITGVLLRIILYTSSGNSTIYIRNNDVIQIPLDCYGLITRIEVSSQTVLPEEGTNLNIKMYAIAPPNWALTENQEEIQQEVREIQQEVGENQQEIKNVKDSADSINNKKISNFLISISTNNETENLYTWGQKTTGSHIVFPVNPNDEIYIKANKTNICTYAIVKDYITPVTGEIPIYSTAEGFTNKIQIQKTEETSFIVPEDGKYLIINRHFEDRSYIPEKLLINGINVLENITDLQEDIKDLQEDVKNLTSKTLEVASKLNYTTSKNLLPVEDKTEEKTSTISEQEISITYTANNGIVNITGSSALNAIFNICDPFMLPKGTYTISGVNSNGNDLYLQIYQYDINTNNLITPAIVQTTNKITFTLDADTIIRARYHKIKKSDDIDESFEITSYPMIESGSQATNFEPYKVSSINEVNNFTKTLMKNAPWLNHYDTSKEYHELFKNSWVDTTELIKGTSDSKTAAILLSDLIPVEGGSIIYFSSYIEPFINKENLITYGLTVREFYEDTASGEIIAGPWTSYNNLTKYTNHSFTLRENYSKTITSNGQTIPTSGPIKYIKVGYRYEYAPNTLSENLRIPFFCSIAIYTDRIYNFTRKAFVNPFEDASLTITGNPTKLNFMSFNVGMYNSSTSRYISDGELLDFKKMLMKAQADAIMIQEEHKYLNGDNTDANNNIGTQLTREYLYWPIYPFNYSGDDSSGYFRNASIHSKYPLSNQCYALYSFATGDWVLSNGEPALYSHGIGFCAATIEVSNKITLLIISTHTGVKYDRLVTDSENQPLQDESGNYITEHVDNYHQDSIPIKNSQYEAMFKWANGEIALPNINNVNQLIYAPSHTHCIIGLDSNSSLEEDRINILAHAEEYGFSPANGGYVGWFKTTPLQRNPIDNIFCSKGMIFDNIEPYNFSGFNVRSDHNALVVSCLLYPFEENNNNITN